MCRFLLFKGRSPILLADLLTRPQHSIINQSFDCRLRVDQRRPLNGDGFGVGWYCIEDDKQRHFDGDQQEPKTPRMVRRQSVSIDVMDGLETIVSRSEVGGCASAPPSVPQVSVIDAYTADGGPCVFTSILPAWNNLNLIRLAEKIRSALVFAHVRAASAGFPISETNCHPWSYGQFLWMHNGFIADFAKIKRQVLSSLRDELFHFVQGNTDSEWAFAVFLNQFSDPLNGSYSAEEIEHALMQTIAAFNRWFRVAEITSKSLMNFAVTDGRTMICSRYVNSKELEPASLYFSSGSRFEECEPGQYKMVRYLVIIKRNSCMQIKADKREDIVVIASEPLTYEQSDWIPVPANTVITVTERLNVLIHPIPDEYFTTQRRNKNKPGPSSLAVWG